MTTLFTLVLIAGGQSRRMGRAKARLPVPPGNQPLLCHIHQRLQALPIEQLLIVANDPTLAHLFPPAARAQVVADAYPNSGPLGGIATGLRACAGWGIFLACDLPLINPHMIQHLCRLVEEESPHRQSAWDAIVPVVAGYEQTLHALYHRRALPIIEQTLANGQLHTTSFLPAVQTRWVREEELRPIDPDFHSFLNANTPEEWAEACALLNRTTENT
jgi:molybdenum cofactor guanylyltransferase